MDSIRTNYDNILKYSTNGIMFIDRDGTILEVNDTICQILNYDKKDLEGVSTLSESSLDMVPIDAIGKEPLVLERKLVRKDGEFIDTQIKARLLENDIVLVIISDITRTKKLERELSIANDLLDKRTMEMKCLNKISKYTWDNETNLELILFLIVETIPTGWYYPDDLVASIEINDEVYLSQKNTEVADNLESPITINDLERGKITVWYQHTHPRQDIGPFLLEEDVLLSNITDRVGKLIERRENRKRLQIQEKKLMQTEKLEAVGKLAGGISHDFNNLLTAIIGFTELAQFQLDDDSDISRYLAQIQSSAERGSKLTRQLLAFSKHEFLNPELLKIDEIIDDLDSILKRLIREDINLIYEFATDTGVIKMDYSQIERIIINLVINGRDAMPNGGILALSSHNRIIEPAEIPNLTPGRYLELKIADTGVGMTKKVKQKIFDPFFTTKSDGTGLGLSTVYGIVNHYNGHIKVESKLQKGTIVSVLLPTVNEEPEQKRVELEETTQTIPPKTILVVEDEATIANIIENALQTINHKVHLFREPLLAMDWGQEHLSEIDLIITDMVMPQMNGIEFINLLNMDHEAPEILFISGYSSKVLEEYGQPPTRAHFLRKPFSINKLQQELVKIFTTESDEIDEVTH